MKQHFVSHLEAAIDGSRLENDRLRSLHKSRPIWVRYDIEAIGHLTKRLDLLGRKNDMWRYRELMPVSSEDNIVSLGEGMTPLLKVDRLASHFGLKNVYVKDEAQLPTASFKSRGMSAAISMAKEYNVKKVAVPSAGNAASACAAYAARAGMEAYVFMPQDTSASNIKEAALYGAKVYLVDGLITDCGKIVKDGLEKKQWHDLSTLKEPYRIEGKKTMGLELAEQLNWVLPDVIVYPTGGGTGLIGMWKAFHELKELGWLNESKMPRMVSVQSKGCCPIVTAFVKGKRFAEIHKNAATIASGLRVPSAIGDFMILDALNESDGCAVAVEEADIVNWMSLTSSSEGISMGPESACCIGAVEKLTRDSWIKPDEKVVIFNCGSALKYPHIIDVDAPVLHPNDIDWAQIH